MKIGVVDYQPSWHERYKHDETFKKDVRNITNMLLEANSGILYGQFKRIAGTRGTDVARHVIAVAGIEGAARAILSNVAINLSGSDQDDAILATMEAVDQHLEDYKKKLDEEISQDSQGYLDLWTSSDAPS